MPKYLVSNMLGSQQTYTNFLWNCCGHHMPEWPKRQLCQHPLSARFFAYFGADRRPWVGGRVSLLVLREQEPVYYHLINEQVIDSPSSAPPVAVMSWHVGITGRTASTDWHLLASRNQRTLNNKVSFWACYQSTDM